MRFGRAYAGNTSGPTLRGAEKQVVAYRPGSPVSRGSGWPAIGAPGPGPATNVSSAYSSGTFPLMRSKGGTYVRQLNPSQSSNSDVTTTIAGTAVTSKARNSRGSIPMLP